MYKGIRGNVPLTTMTEHYLIRKALLAGFIGLSILFSSHIFAQTGTLRGTVRLSDGAPAAFASVTCRPSGQQTLTDEKGEFTFSGLPAGVNLVIYKMLGHQSPADSVVIQNGQTSYVKGRLNLKAGELNEVVVTGQSEPMTLKNSVYQVRTISSEKIRLRGATNLQTVLNTELGIRLSNDMALGTTDVELLGMSGQRVKVLLDGIPLLDRGEIRESIGQIDINTIDRVEIVEGPMSVIYGTDALAGVINIITKKGSGAKSLDITTRVQEETANDEYAFLKGAGVHNENLNVTFRNRPWDISAAITRNNFGGWQGNSTGRAKSWTPKDQLLAMASLGYRTDKLTLWYRFNGTDEDLIKEGNIVLEGTPQELWATDQKFTTWRLFHQAQADYKVNDKLTVNVAGSYTDYSRKTLTTNTNFSTGRTTRSLADGSQDKSNFGSAFGRAIVSYTLNPSVLLMGGVEYNFNDATGARIEGSPVIHDYAAFLTPEIRLANDKINLRPGVRLIHNSVYDAPPAIPSINAKLKLSPKADLRLAYSKGFRAPTLRELYFWFFDASHSMKGNPNLKAESSNSFNGSLNLTLIQSQGLTLEAIAGGFYNTFHDFIELANDPKNVTIYSYFNISKSQTAGGSFNTKLLWGAFHSNLGVQWTGIYNQVLASDPGLDVPKLNWTPEVNANLIYRFAAIRTSLNLSYKYTGVRPNYQFAGNTVSEGIVQTSTGSFHMADFSANKVFGKSLTINAGIRNLFNVTSLTNTAVSSGTGHSTSGPVPMSYGRSYFLGIQYSLNVLK